MTEHTHDDGNGQSNAKSSIGVAQQIICEDEACIGKNVNPEDSPAPETAATEAKTKGSTRSSMGVGGDEICSDDACIGKD